MMILNKILQPINVCVMVQIQVQHYQLIIPNVFVIHNRII